jgi:bifunctional non-homologous end joining protein LigD
VPVPLSPESPRCPWRAYTRRSIHPDWIFELKYDGFRAVANVENGAVRRVSRKGNVYRSFPALIAVVTSTVIPLYTPV